MKMEEAAAAPKKLQLEEMAEAADGRWRKLRASLGKATTINRKSFNRLVEMLQPATITATARDTNDVVLASVGADSSMSQTQPLILCLSCAATAAHAMGKKESKGGRDDWI